MCFKIEYGISDLSPSQHYSFGLGKYFKAKSVQFFDYELGQINHSHLIKEPFFIISSAKIAHMMKNIKKLRRGKIKNYLTLFISSTIFHIFEIISNAEPL